VQQPTVSASRLGGRASAEATGAIVEEVGRSAEVGVRVEVGVSPLVRVGRVGAVVVKLGDSVTLGAGRVPEEMAAQPHPGFSNCA
jgi:hypothetical protein